jgi:Zinc carboxypeptidase
MRRLTAGITAAATLSLCLNGVATAGAVTPLERAAASCSPVTTEAHFRGSVPTPQHVLGYRLGSREATDGEIGRYWNAVDDASKRVRTGVFAHSWEGRPLRYALVGRAATLNRLIDIRHDLARLRDPSTPDTRASAIIRRSPAILWITANVHGNEPSGGDAVLRLLYELADRSDCVAKAILDNAVVGLIPSQNPDGRHNDRRYNASAFDMNRDWFARTQPETAGKLDLLWKYPPQLFVDEHENDGRSYFFPPNADPIYAETPNPTYNEIANLYGDANAAAFRKHDWRFETFDAGYDLFYQGYGDTVPTTEFGAAGMTYEQGGDSPYPVRVRHHYTTGLVSLYAGATHRESILRRWRATFVHAEAEGARCHLEPNVTVNPGHTVHRQVPDRRVCGYFLPGHSAGTRLVVHRLQGAHVVVNRLLHATVVRDYRPYGRAPRRTTMPAGTYWVSLEQPQKHWVQAMLNEDTYVPFPYFYDVSGWSNPLLAGVPGGSTGRPVTTALAQVKLPRKLPRIAVLDQFGETIDDYQTTGWLKWRLGEDWHMPYRVLHPHQVNASSLRRVDVLLVPNVDAKPVFRRLGQSGRQAIRQWVRNGGRYVGWQEGALLASALGVSTVGMSDPQAESPGALIRIRTTHGPNEIMWDNYYAPQMSPGGARVIGAFPEHLFVSGYAKKAGTLAGSAAEAVDDVAQGSVTVFSYEPNFRAFTDGSARLLFRAILHTPLGSLAGARGSAAKPVLRGISALKLGHRPAERLAHDNRELP